jgi:transcription termination/antitermination protein NusG
MSEGINESNELKWYVVHTYSGCEAKVRDSLLAAVEADHLQEDVIEILVPTEEVAEIKGGKKRISTKKIYPGYIIANMKMNDTNWHLIRNTPNVTGFVGPSRQPTPLSEAEVADIMRHMQETEESPRQKIVFETGERVKVIEGPFFNFTGYVQEINQERGRLKVMVEILGRSTPVELDFLQVEKVG